MIKGFEIPQGFKLVNPKPLDTWTGPYTGVTTNDAVSLAVSTIPIEIRYQTMKVQIISHEGGAMEYWFKSGVTDNDLIYFSPEKDRLDEEIQNRIDGDRELLETITANTETYKGQFVFKTGDTMTGTLNIGYGGLNVTGDTHINDSLLVDNTLEVLNKISARDGLDVTGDTNIYGIIYQNEDKIVTQPQLENTEKATADSLNELFGRIESLENSFESGSYDSIIANNITVVDTIQTYGDIKTDGKLEVEKTSDFKNSVNIVGDVNVSGKTVSDNGFHKTNSTNNEVLTASGGTKNISDFHLVNDPFITLDTITASGDTLNITGNTSFKDNVIIDKQLTVSENINADSDLLVQGNVYITGNTRIEGYVDAPILQAVIDAKLNHGLIENKTQLNSLLTGSTFGTYLMMFESPESFIIKDSNNITYTIPLNKALLVYSGSGENKITQIYTSNALTTGFTGPIEGVLVSAINNGNVTELHLSPLTIYGDSKELNNRVLDLELEVISDLYTPDGLKKVVHVDAGGNVHIEGDVYQSGSTYETHAEQIFTKTDTIILREGATAGLSDGEYAGLVAKLYDGLNDGMIAIDNNGTLRIGDVGDLQPIATREEAPVNYSPVFWNQQNLRFQTLSGSTVKASLVDADSIVIKDSLDSDKPKWWSFANMKSDMKSYFDPQYLRLSNVNQTVSGITAFVQSPIVPDNATAKQAVNYDQMTAYSEAVIAEVEEIVGLPAVEVDSELAIQDLIDYRDAALAAKNASELAQANAEQAEANAELAETNAETAETNAKTAQGLAEQARDAAQQAEANAELAETNAELAQAAAESAAASAAADASAIFQSSYPLIPYRSRVEADLGSIQDLEELTKHYIENLDLMNSAAFLWAGWAGMKERISASNRFASKIYNMGRLAQQFGSELVTNGTFTGVDGSAPAGWASSGANLTIDTNRLKIYNTLAYGGGLTSFPTVIGKTYHVTASFTYQDVSGSLSIANSGFGASIVQTGSMTSSKTFTLSFVATAAITFVNLANVTNSTDKISYWDNISVKQMDWVAGTNDALQTTEANQPYIGGFIAPNEVRKIKNITDNKVMQFVTPMVLNSTGNNGFTITTVLKPYFMTVGTGGNKGKWTAGIELFYNPNGSIMLYSGVLGGTLQSIGFDGRKTQSATIVTVVADSSSLRFIINGIPYATSGNYTAGIGNLLQLFDAGGDDAFAGEIYHFSVHNRALSASEIQSQYKFLRSFIPEIEGVDIGNQHWATSNYEAVVAGDGSVIPEVQPTAATATELASPIDLTAVWAVVGTATINDADSFATTGAGGVKRSYSLVIGRAYKLTFAATTSAGTVKFYNSDGTIANEITSGVPFVAANANLFINNDSASTTDITAFSLKQAGWDEMTALYDAVYAKTSGTPAVKELAALKAAAAWCYYDNNVNNGAIRGKNYNDYALELIDRYLVGWRVPRYADYEQLVNYLGAPPAGGSFAAVKAPFAQFIGNSTNSSGLSIIPTGRRGADGTFDLQDRGYIYLKGNIIIAFTNSTTVASTGVSRPFGCQIRLIRNEPTGPDKVQYATGLFTTDIASSARQLPVSFGRTVETIRITSEQALTNVEVKLHNTAGTAVATLITGKTVAAGATMVFPVLADHAALQTDGTLRITATGNSGSVTGMEMMAVMTKTVISVQ